MKSKIDSNNLIPWFTEGQMKLRDGMPVAARPQETTP